MCAYEIIKINIIILDTNGRLDSMKNTIINMGFVIVTTECRK